MREPTEAQPALRIALLTHSVNPRGGVVHTLELGEALHAAGHAVTVMAPAAPGQGFFRANACAVELVPVPPAPRDVAAMVGTRIEAWVAHLTALLRQQTFDVFHAQDSIGGNVLATLRERGMIAGFTRTVHHLDHFDDPRLAAWQQRAFAEANQVLCVSRLWCDTLQREHGMAAALVHNGVDTRRFHPTPQRTDADVAVRHGLRPGAPMVLAVGGIEARKNSLRLWDAFVRLRSRMPHAQLVIAGGASLLDHGAYGRAFAGALAASGLREGPGQALVVTGTVADADMPALYRLADAVAMPSLREGFGLAALEALACGTPTVVSRVAPFTEHFGDDDVCWADPLDAASIADALQRAVTTPRFAPPAVCLRYDWAASAERHALLYRRALQPRMPSPPHPPSHGEAHRPPVPAALSATC